MVSPASKTALKIAQKRKRAVRLNSLFDYVKRWCEAPLIAVKIVDRGRAGYVEVKCTDHDRILKVKTKKQLMKEDLILCKACSKERYSANMMKKMHEFDVKMIEKYTINAGSKITLHGMVKKDIADYEREIRKLPPIKITPEMISSGLEDYYNRGGKITKIG